MKKSFPLLFTLISALILMPGCEKIKAGGSDVFTDEYELTGNSVFLQGRVLFNNADLDKVSDVYFLLSKNSKPSDKNAKKIESVLSDKYFSGVVPSLELLTTYYYQAVAVYQGKKVYGDIRHFNTTEYTLNAVDLGIVVDGKNIKWASANIGAYRSVEYGSYFAWGETKTKAEFTWENYKWGKSKDNLKKYKAADMTLEPEDDAAHVHLGGNWRMPTQKEFKALLDTKGKEGYEWNWYRLVVDKETEEPVLNANGEQMAFIRIKNTTTGNYINIPFAGQKYNSTYYGITANSPYGWIWSSSIYNNDYSSAYDFFFYGGNYWNVDATGTCWRYYGLPIRAVCE